MSSEIIYSPITSTRSIKVTQTENTLEVKTDRDEHLTATFSIQENQLSLHLNAGKESKELTDAALEYLFGSLPHITSIGVFQFPTAHVDVLRSEFFQNPALWTYKKAEALTPERWTETNGRAHPVRPRFSPGYLYRRHIPVIGKTLSFRLITLDDLDTFHEWHNQILLT